MEQNLAYLTPTLSGFFPSLPSVQPIIVGDEVTRLTHSSSPALETSQSLTSPPTLGSPLRFLRYLLFNPQL